ncbi:hypothetical protein E2C01_085594 [Portunus trituberculatus]|uniref:Uncharacterized protein n=1 Tax=Portunus trituberculatus TaxID=210409 RepID=A0A5B7J756_PORTR|nr:hypothetical protein [Portunus trituberculatus]
MRTVGGKWRTLILAAVNGLDHFTGRKFATGFHVAAVFQKEEQSNPERSKAPPVTRTTHLPRYTRIN